MNTCSKVWLFVKNMFNYIGNLDEHGSKIQRGEQLLFPLKYWVSFIIVMQKMNGYGIKEWIEESNSISQDSDKTFLKYKSRPWNFFLHEILFQKDRLKKIILKDGIWKIGPLPHPMRQLGTAKTQASQGNP